MHALDDIEASQTAHDLREVNAVTDGDVDAHIRHSAGPVRHVHVLDAGTGIGDLGGNGGQESALIGPLNPQFDDEVTLDIDSYPIPVHGHQAGSEHNGYYKTRCYHPLGVMLGETGHSLDLKLRPGNVSTADGANEMLAPLIDRARTELSENVRVRGDAGFIGAETLAMLDAKDVPYALRLPTNANLKAYEEIHAVRPPGRPPGYERIWSHEIEHRALTWEKPRRVVLVVGETTGELFLRSFFIVTSSSKDEKCGGDVLDRALSLIQR